MQFRKIVAECQISCSQISLNEDGSVLEYGSLPFTTRLPSCPHLQDPTSPKYLYYAKHKCGQKSELFNGKCGKYSTVNTVYEGFKANCYSDLRAIFLNPEPNTLFK